MSNFWGSYQGVVDTMALDEVEASGKLRVISVLPNGRRQYDPVAKERLIGACLEPGVSVARLALDHGINANLLRNWVVKRRYQKKHGLIDAGEHDPATPFVPVIEAPAQITASAGSGVVAIERHGTSGKSANETQRLSRTQLKASLPNGATLTLEGDDPRWLSVMIEALGRCDVPAR
jgi:transposase